MDRKHSRTEVTMSDPKSGVSAETLRAISTPEDVTGPRRRLPLGI